MCNGIFGNIFDFNNDGQLDAFEQVAELSFIEEAVLKDEESESSSDFDSDNFFDDGMF